MPLLVWCNQTVFYSGLQNNSRTFAIHVCWRYKKPPNKRSSFFYNEEMVLWGKVSDRRFVFLIYKKEKHISSLYLDLCVSNEKLLFYFPANAGALFWAAKEFDAGFFKCILDSLERLKLSPWHSICRLQSLHWRKTNTRFFWQIWPCPIKHPSSCADLSTCNQVKMIL